MIFKGSRYEKVGVSQSVDARGRTVTALKIRFIPPTPAGFFNTVNASDRLDLLAYRFYRNPEKFWLIADANTEMDPEDLLAEPGRVILIPPDRGAGG
jgi:hypothetical protein